MGLGDLQIYDIIIFAGVAVFLVFRLRNVLGSQNILYGGQKGITPFYIHALIINSYIESAWRFVNGSSQVAIFLAKSIKSFGGEVLKKSEVKTTRIG